MMMGSTESSTHLLLLLPSSSRTKKAPKDKWQLAYITYFTLGLSYVLPWNVFITAVDYFSYLYPHASVDRTFAVIYTVVTLLCLFLIIIYRHKSDAYVRINVGQALFIASLLLVPLVDVFYVKGRVGFYYGFYVTVGTVGISGVANALVQGSVLGSAGELPEKYTQAVISGSAASGIFSYYYPLHMFLTIFCFLLAQKLPIMKYYNELKINAISADENNGPLIGSVWKSTVWDIVKRIKWYGFDIMLIYVVTMAIFPGYITEDVHSHLLKDWYPILLITCFNVFDLFGRCLTAVYLLEDAKIATVSCIGRLLFFPLFLGCLHGPKFFRTDIPVTILTCLLGLTSGYLTSVLMILAPKTVKLQHAETAGIVSVLFLVIGLAAGSIIVWFWVI